MISVDVGRALLTHVGGVVGDCELVQLHLARYNYDFNQFEILQTSSEANIKFERNINL